MTELINTFLPDTPVADLPSEQALAGLSWHAQAAYATRCARRAQPLYVTTDQASRKGLHDVIAAAEAFVQGTGDGYRANAIFTETSFTNLPFEMARATFNRWCRCGRMAP